jgi:hypothetical protein
LHCRKRGRRRRRRGIHASCSGTMAFGFAAAISRAVYRYARCRDKTLTPPGAAGFLLTTIDVDTNIYRHSVQLTNVNCGCAVSRVDAVTLAPTQNMFNITAFRSCLAT